MIDIGRGLIRRRFSGRVVTLLIAGIYTAVSLLLGQFTAIGGGFVVQVSDGLAFPFGALFGLPGAVGMSIGVLILDAVQSTLGLRSVASSLAVFALAHGGRALWRRSGVRCASFLESGTLGGWARTLLAGVISCVAAAGVFAWLTELLGLFPFYVSFPITAVSYTLATVLLAPPIIVFVRWTDVPPGLVRVPSPTSGATASGSLWTVAAVTGCWVTLSSLASLMFAIREKVSIQAFERYDVMYLYEYGHPDLLGHGARRAQVLFGGVVLAVLVQSLRTDRSAEGQ